MTPEENTYASNVKFAKFNQENKAKIPTLAAEWIGWNNGERLVTGKDPLTDGDTNRWAAGVELYSMKIKEQTRKRPEGCTWVRQGEADVVWRDFRRVLAVDIASKLRLAN